MSKKIAIFPVNHENATLVRYAYMGNYQPIALLSPELNVLEGQDISKLDGSSEAYIPLCIDYEEKIKDSDTVYFATSRDEKINKLYLKLLEYAENLKKEILMSRAAAKQFGKKYQKETIKNKKNLFYNESSEKLLQIETPIISVFSIGEKCGQVQTELLLRKYFLNKGYNVLQIGSNDFMELLGCLNIPDFMFDSTIQSFDKVILFNNFVYNQSKLKKADIILLGIQNPIMKYNDSNLCGLGIFPFIMQSAVRSDIGVINMHYANYTFDFLEEVKKFCRYRLDVDTRFFSIGNTSVLKNVDSPTKLEYLYLTYDFVKHNIKPEIGGEDFTVFTGYCEEDAYKAFQKIEKELQENPEQI